jgi:hypothetical protein
MEQEEDGKKRAHCAQSEHYLMFFVRVCKYYQAFMCVELTVILVYLVQENKSYGDKPFAFIL